MVVFKDVCSRFSKGIYMSTVLHDIYSFLENMNLARQSVLPWVHTLVWDLCGVSC